MIKNLQRESYMEKVYLGMSFKRRINNPKSCNFLLCDDFNLCFKNRLIWRICTLWLWGNLFFLHREFFLRWYKKAKRKSKVCWSLLNPVCFSLCVFLSFCFSVSLFLSPSLSFCVYLSLSVCVYECVCVFPVLHQPQKVFRWPQRIKVYFLREKSTGWLIIESTHTPPIFPDMLKLLLGN